MMNVFAFVFFGIGCLSFMAMFLAWCFGLSRQNSQPSARLITSLWIAPTAFLGAAVARYLA